MLCIKKKQQLARQCELHAAAIPAIIAVGSHIIAQKLRDARAHHVSAIAAIIAVGSHTIAQSDIRTSFSKENSEHPPKKQYWGDHDDDVIFPFIDM